MKRHVGLILMIVGLAGFVWADVYVKDEGSAVGPAKIVNCSGAGITCTRSGTTATVSVSGVATSLAANPTDCSAGQYATAIDASGNLTCSAPPKGEYVFGGYSPPSYATGTQFARFKSVNAGTIATIHFVTTTAAAGGGPTKLKVLDDASGTVICTLSVTCATPAGTGFDGTCLGGADGSGALSSGRIYKFQWDTVSTCATTLGGNADIVVNE